MEYYYTFSPPSSSFLKHYGVKGMKWEDHVYVDPYYNGGLGKSDNETARSRTGVIAKKKDKADLVKKGGTSTSGGVATKTKKEEELPRWVKVARGEMEDPGKKTDSAKSKIGSQSTSSSITQKAASLGASLINKLRSKK